MEVDDEGNVHVVERARRTIVLPELEGLVRAHQIRSVFDDVIVLDDGRLLGANTALRFVIEDEHRFVLLDSLGNELTQLAPMPNDPEPVFLANGRDGHFWAPYVDEYRIEKYDMNGDLRQVIRRSPDWFRPSETDESPPPFSRPTFGQVFENDRGRLWSVIRVPAEDRDTAEAALEGAIRMDELNRDDVQDTVIEILDPDQGVVVSRLHLPEAMIHVQDRFLVHKTHSPEGLVQATFFHLSLSAQEMEGRLLTTAH